MKYFAYIIIAVVAAVIVTGFFFVGSPKEERMRRFDGERIQHLQQLQWNIIEYWQSKNKLPAKLADLNDPTSARTVRPDDLEAAFAKIEGEARAAMADSGIALATTSVRRLADGRFVGQGFDLVVTLPDGPYADDEATRLVLQESFVRAYREKFALTPPNVPIEFINVRVTVRAPIAGAEMRLPLAGGSVGDAIKGVRRAYFPEAGGWADTTVYDRERLAPGFEFVGPAVVEEEGSTLVVGLAGRVHVSRAGNLVVTLR